ncbi:Reticulon [Musa troglodytarum]|uniref:Reticulon-like protein n=1 Tax=Musa troglodytarum TaxID=320322 RepID=A0A9E7GQU5_9LILI|nr:Reticulon [Musa troglodytarum]
MRLHPLPPCPLRAGLGDLCTVPSAAALVLPFALHLPRPRFSHRRFARLPSFHLWMLLLRPVADVLLWRQRNAAVLAAVGATTVWFLFERVGYSFLSVFANAILLLVLILFFWAKSALLLNRPLPPLPNLEISDEVVGTAADGARVWINRVLAIGHDITIRRDRKVFLQVILVLWFIGYIGRLFNFLTLVYIGFLLSITIPALYDKYQDHVDERFGVAHDAVMKQYGSILSRIQAQPTKEKKTQ